MSLVVAMKVTCGDIVLVADRRATVGDPRGLVGLDEQVSKLHEYTTGAALGIVGVPGVVVPAVQRGLEILTSQGIDPLQALRTALAEHYLKNYGARPFITDKPLIDSRPDAALLYADYAGQRLVILPSEMNFAPVDDGRPYAMLGVTPYAMYLYQRLWRSDFSPSEAVRLGLFLVTETSQLDPKVGPDCNVLILEKAGISRPSSDDIGQIVEENRERFASFAKSFKDNVP
jgi:hypothetical protein